jgi:hypothetical protein
MLGILVDAAPRPWWRSERISKFIADFYQPLDILIDKVLKQLSSDQVGETHATRIDFATESGKRISVVQAHESFRRIVGQSCAELALDAFENPLPGVFLPEQRCRQQSERSRIMKKLTSTPETFAYTGPLHTNAGNDPKHPKIFPTNVDQAVAKTRQAEKTVAA